MTSEVVTRWYRPPELLFGAQSYSSGVDIWAVGCIFAEIILRTPLFPGLKIFYFMLCNFFSGESDMEQLGKIFNVLGTPNSTNWPDVDLLVNYVQFESRDALNLSSLFGDKAESPSSNLNLLLRMLTLNPKDRVTAEEVPIHIFL